MTEDAFLAEIASQPEERSLRLVYADWLEDQGDARAELLRVMEEMRSLAPYGNRYWQLRRRRIKLRRSAADNWFAALGYDVYRPLFGHVPTSREDRWRLMQEFLCVWHGAVEQLGHTKGQINGVENQLQARLPVALREWYRQVGRRRALFSGEGDWHSLYRLRRENRWMLPFMTDRDGLAEYCVRLEPTTLDPIVYDQHWHREDRAHSTFSHFALQVMLYEAARRSGAADGSALERSEAEAILHAHFVRTDIVGTWRSRPLQIWEREEMLAIEWLDGDEPAHFKARTEAAWNRFAQLCPALRHTATTV